MADVSDEGEVVVQVPDGVDKVIITYPDRAEPVTLPLPTPGTGPTPPIRVYVAAHTALSISTEDGRLLHASEPRSEEHVVEIHPSKQ
jgi:hypothetical protein